MHRALSQCSGRWVSLSRRSFQKVNFIHYRHVATNRYPLQVILNIIYGFFLPLSRVPLLVGSASSVVACILFFVAIFTPFSGTITLVALGIALDYVLRVLGIMIFKTIEILGRKREKMKQKTCTGADSPEEKDGNDNGSRSEGISDDLERSRTMDSSITAVSEEAPLRGIRQCNKAVTKNYRIPG